MINDIARKSINVDAPNNVPVAQIKEYDDFILKLALMKYNTPFDCTGQTATLGVKAPSGLFEQTTDITINKDQIDIKLKTGIVSKAGTCAMELKLVDINGSMTTASFFIVVNPKVLNDGAVQATSEFDTLSKTAANIQTDYNSLKKIMIDENNAANLQNQINKSNAQLEDNVHQINETISSYDKNLIEVKQRLFNINLKNRQYIYVGDSLREANGRWTFKKMVYKLAKCGISPCLIGKSGLKAEHWSKTNLVQAINDFPTTDDVIKVIKGDGSECVVDICLCTNDLSKTEAEVVGYLKKGIADILVAKPNTKFILTTPNKYMNTITNNIKAYNIIKTVVDDLKNVAFSDVQNNVFRENEDMIPYMIDDVHPNQLGQPKVAEYKIKQLFDGCETVTHDINFNTVVFNNTDGSKTIIKYAIDYINSDNHMLYLKKDYQNKWCFAIIVNSNWVYSSELIASDGINILMPRFNSSDMVYGILEVENINGLINNASQTTLAIGTTSYNISTKIDNPLIQTPSTIYNLLNNIKFWDINGEMDKTDILYKQLANVSLKVGFYQTDGGAEPPVVYFKRINENEYFICDADSNAICKQLYLSKDGVFNLEEITWGTIRATGKLKIKNFASLKQNLPIDGRIKILNAQQYTPIVEKSIIELLDY